MGEDPLLEDIVSDFIDDIVLKIKGASRGGDVYEANGLAALFHNAYTQINNDTRCEDFAREMSKWAMNYTTSARATNIVKLDKQKNIAPHIRIAAGIGVAAISTYQVVTEQPMILWAMGYFLSTILILNASKSLKKMRGESKAPGFFSAKPYEQYVEDIKTAPAQAVREALEAKREYAFAQLDLIPRLDLIPQLPE